MGTFLVHFWLWHDRRHCHSRLYTWISYGYGDYTGIHAFQPAYQSLRRAEILRSSSNSLDSLTAFVEFSKLMRSQSTTNAAVLQSLYGQISTTLPEFGLIDYAKAQLPLYTGLFREDGNWDPEKENSGLQHITCALSGQLYDHTVLGSCKRLQLQFLSFRKCWPCWQIRFGVAENLLNKPLAGWHKTPWSRKKNLFDGET